MSYINSKWGEIDGNINDQIDLINLFTSLSKSGIYQADTFGILSNIYFRNKDILAILGGGLILIKEVDFTKNLADEIVSPTDIDFRFTENQKYLVIFG